VDLSAHPHRARRAVDIIDVAQLVEGVADEAQAVLEVGSEKQALVHAEPGIEPDRDDAGDPFAQIIVCIVRHLAERNAVACADATLEATVLRVGSGGQRQTAEGRKNHQFALRHSILLPELAGRSPRRYRKPRLIDQKAASSSG
jgi:hypothetical protein